MDQQPLLNEKAVKITTINRLISDEFNYQRRAYIFMAVNTVNMVLTIYNLLSPINIEGYSSLLFYPQQNSPLQQGESISLLNLLVSLVTIHMIRLLTCILGYFSLSQKSGHLLTYFMIMSTACVLIRAIISLMIILNYGEIVTAIKAIYHTENEPQIATSMATSFVIILIVFVLIESVLALVSLIQCSKSKEDYATAKKQKAKILRNSQLVYEVAVNQIND